MASAGCADKRRRLDTKIGVKPAKRWRHRYHRCKIPQSIASHAIVDHDDTIGVTRQATRERGCGHPAAQVRA
ncbi:hypothetical protein NHF48_019365 [Sphingomonas sp. H160509]|nr:hypothetical protein [Sphingomonas sp. H160509]MDD1452593.1 hypothetical protein [Sphingomonas sp. H160509]